MGIEDQILVAIYKLGRKGREGVSSIQLQEAGFSPKEIFEATETKSSMLIGLSSHQIKAAWCLNPKGIAYVEALLNELE